MKGKEWKEAMKGVKAMKGSMNEENDWFQHDIRSVSLTSLTQLRGLSHTSPGTQRAWADGLRAKPVQEGDSERSGVRKQVRNEHIHWKTK